MKYAISGAHSCGKSTIIKALQNDANYNSYVLITEIVRSLALQGVKINKGADHNSQLIILEEHYKNTLRYDNFITDRCSLDAFTYACWDYLNGAYSYKEHKEHESLFLDSLKEYDIIFYIAPEFDIVDDGFRSTDSKYQKEIHEIFLKNIKKYKIQVTKLSGSVEERINTLNKHI